MKPSLILAFMILQYVGFCQSLNLEDFKNQNYKIDTIKISTGESTIHLFLVNEKTEPEGTKIWLLQKHIDSVLHFKFLGQIESEHGFYIPKIQPLDNYFIIVECSEYNGLIQLIDSKGKWTEMPGYYYALKGDYLYSKAAGEGKQTVSKYNLTTGVLKTKTWNNIHGSDPWNIENMYNYEDNIWMNTYRRGQK